MPHLLFRKILMRNPEFISFGLINFFDLKGMMVTVFNYSMDLNVYSAQRLIFNIFSHGSPLTSIKRAYL